MAEQISSYRLEGEIARGGMGIVYRAVHTVFDEVVAIKAIFPELTLNPELRARFVNEAKIQRRLQHPNIVQIREFLIDQDRFYIVMDLIEGETLADRLRRIGGPLPANEALDIFRQALRGLGFAHAQGVIHRDIKPSNIMITREGVAKLTDFGIARAVDVPGLTRTGTALGTPAYMSPEQVQGHKLDHRSDIYSLGITLYEIMAGRVPFERPKDSDGNFQVLRAHIEEPPPPPSRFVAAIPPFIEGAILKALAKRPDERFASCGEFEAALAHQELPTTRRVVSTIQQSVASTPAAPATRVIAKAEPPQQAPAAMKTRLSHRWAVLVLAAALGVGGYWLYRMRPGPPPTVTPSPTGELPGTNQSPRAPVAQPPTEPGAAGSTQPATDLAAKQGPYTVEDLIKLVQGGVNEKLMLELVKERGIKFTLTPQVLADLLDNGVPPSVLGEIRKLIPPYRPYTLKQTLSGDYDGGSVAFSPDGHILGSGGWRGKIALWDVSSGVLKQTLSGGEGSLHSVAFSPDGRLLASATVFGTIKLWDVERGALRQTLRGHKDMVYSLAFSPDGRLLASGGGKDKTINLWEVPNGALQQTLDGDAAFVAAVAFSPDGRLLASSGGNNTIKLWDVASRTLMQTLTGHQHAVYSVAISPNGHLLASGSEDKTIKLWDVSSGALKETLTGHKHIVTSVAFSPDERSLASGSVDNTIKLWDVSSGVLKQTLTGQEHIVMSVAFSPDERTLASGSGDRKIKLWERAPRVAQTSLVDVWE